MCWWIVICIAATITAVSSTRPQSPAFELFHPSFLSPPPHHTQSFHSHALLQHYSLMLDEQGNEVINPTVEDPIPSAVANVHRHINTGLPFNDPELLHTLVSSYSNLNYTIFHYTVQLKQDSKVLDNDQNILEVTCSVVGQQLQLVIAASNIQSAYSEYCAQSSMPLVHGSNMWKCNTHFYVQVLSCSQPDTATSTISMLAEPLSNGYRDMMDSAQIVFHQPAHHAEPYNGNQAAHFHVMNNEVTISVSWTDQQLTPSSILTVSFSPVSAVGSSFQVHLKHHCIVCTNDDDLGYVTINTNSLSCSGSTCTFNVALSSFSSPSASLNFYYVQLQYSCLPILGCSNSNSQRFWIPMTTSGSIFGDNHGNPTNFAYSRSCVDVQGSCGSSSLSTIDQVFCAICAPSRNFNLTVACEQCSLSYTASLDYFNLDYDAISIHPYLTTSIQASAQLHSVLNLKTDIDFAFLGSVQDTVVNNVVIPTPYSITVFGITIGLVIEFQLNLAASYIVNVNAQIRSSTALHGNVVGVTTYDSRGLNGNPSDVTAASTLSPAVYFDEQPTIAIKAEGEASAEIALIPIVKVGLAHVAYAILTVQTYVDVNASASFPPFEPLSVPYQLPSPAPGALLHYGSCTEKHLVRYGVIAGWRTGSVSLALQEDLAGAISSELSQFDYSYTFGSLSFPDERWQIVSGCLAQLNWTGGDELVYTFKVPAVMNATYSVAFKINLQYDLADMVSSVSNAYASIDPSRFHIQLLDGSELINQTEIFQSLAMEQIPTHHALSSSKSHHFRTFQADSSVNSVAVTILPADSSSNNQPDSAAIAQALRSATPSGVVAQQLVLQSPSSSSSSSSSAGVIAGAVVGTIGGLLLIAAIVYAVLYYRKHHTASAATDKQASAAPAPTIQPNVVLYHPTVATTTSVPTTAASPPPLPPTSPTPVLRFHMASPSSTNSSPSPPPLPTSRRPKLQSGPEGVEPASVQLHVQPGAATHETNTPVRITYAPTPSPSPPPPPLPTRPPTSQPVVFIE